MNKSLLARVNGFVSFHGVMGRLLKRFSNNFYLVGVTILVWLGLVYFDVGLRNEALPFGIVSLEIPASVEHAWTAINAWHYQQQNAALASVGLDYVFIVCYVLLLCRWGRWLKKRGQTLPRGKLSIWIAGCVNIMVTLAVTAGLCDVMENLALKAMIERAETQAVAVAAAKGYLVHTAFFHAYLITKSCAIIKFFCLGVLCFLGSVSTLWFWCSWKVGGHLRSPTINI